MGLTHKAAIPALLALYLSSCASGGSDFETLSKALEHGAYDELATVFSKFCQRTSQAGQVIAHARIELTREIRQRGRAGPPGPSVGTAGSRIESATSTTWDVRIREGRGPIVMVYCQGRTTISYRDLWKKLDRYWED